MDMQITVLLVRGQSLWDRCIMNDRLKQVCTRCESEGLKINNIKVSLFPLLGKRIYLHLADLEWMGFGCHYQKQSSSFMNLVQKLTWSIHLDWLIRKAKRVLLTFRRMIGLNWRLKLHIAHWLYKSVICPQIQYGALVWWCKAIQTVNGSRLESLQRLASLYFTGAFSTTSDVALQVLLDLMALALTIHGERHGKRLITCNNWAYSGVAFP